MPTGTALVDAKTALVTLLSARDGLDGVVVTRHAPKNTDDLRNSDGAYEAIWIRSANGSYEPTTLRAGVLDLEEQWDLDVVIQVIQRSSTEEATELRATELLDEVLLEIQDDPSLGVTSYRMFQAIPGQIREESGPMEQGDAYGARFELTVEITARIDPSS